MRKQGKDLELGEFPEDSPIRSHNGTENFRAEKRVQTEGTASRYPECQ
jgi:hypothetical protein